MTKTLTDQTLTGVNWNFAGNYSKAIISIFVGVVLARILPPEDFGLLGMVAIFIGLAELFSTMGMGASIIKLKVLNEVHLNTATYFTIFLSFIVYTLFVIGAPYIASFYNEPRLVNILYALSTIFIFKGITTVSYSLLVRKMDFKSTKQIEVSSYFIGSVIVSIGLALLGYGVWSLVLGRLFSSFASLIQTIIKVPLHLKLKIGRKEFNELFFFGTGISLIRFLQYIGNNIDYLIIGKMISSYNLGLYQKSYNLMSQPMQRITGGIYNVLFPALAKVQDDSERLKTGYFRTIRTVAFIVYPVLTVLFISSNYVILGLYGPKWEDAISVFQILVFAGYFSATNNYSGAVANVTGKVYIIVFLQFVYVLIVGVGAYLAVVYGYGIEGVGFAVIVALLWKFIVQSHIAIKIVKSDWMDYLNNFVPGLSISVILAMVISFFQFSLNKIQIDLPEFIVLLIIVFLALVTFIICVIFLPKFLKGDTVSWVLEKYSRFLPKRIVNLYKDFNKS